LRAPGFRALGTYSLAGKTVVITGPTSGLGLAAAGQMASMGAHLILVGRSESRLDSVRAGLTTHVDGPDTVVADMGDLVAVAAAARRIAELAPQIHAIVHNAGALIATHETSPQGHEMTVASHVLGPHLLTTMLLPQLRAGVGRVVTVSSGGMYSATLPPPESGGCPEMSIDSYNGTRQYAIAKRVQVTLNEMWAQREPSVAFAAMHPGWADTPGVQQALPTFRTLTRPLLRSAEQGADTISWLVADDTVPEHSGRFWCDRAVRPIHRLGRTRRSDTPQERDAVWHWCDAQIAPYRA
jgi:NAD(P)-dependent dehydrogenase (short-subunit alcohol dehydrogenase family)